MDDSKIRPRRSFIFTPGLKPEMFPKAVASGADIVCIELEDGIAMHDNRLPIAYKFRILTVKWLDRLHLQHGHLILK